MLETGARFDFNYKKLYFLIGIITVLPDIGFYFRVHKIKPSAFCRTAFWNFLLSWNFWNLFLLLLPWKRLIIMSISWQLRVFSISIHIGSKHLKVPSPVTIEFLNATMTHINDFIKATGDRQFERFLHKVSDGFQNLLFDRISSFKYVK